MEKNIYLSYKKYPIYILFEDLIIITEIQNDKEMDNKTNENSAPGNMTFQFMVCLLVLSVVASHRPGSKKKISIQLFCFFWEVKSVPNSFIKDNTRSAGAWWWETELGPSSKPGGTGGQGFIISGSH